MPVYSIKPTPVEKEDQDLWFKAEMTHRQFLALAHRLTSSDIENEIINLDYFKDKLTSAKKLDLEEIEKWLRNAWNTENILAFNEAIIKDSGQSFALQWAFPQAYYSTFGTLLAHFKAVGYSENSHSAVLKKFGQLVTEDKLPETISFHSNGAKKRLSYGRITKPSDLQTIALDIAIPETVDNQICQFLKSTREIKLSEKAPVLVKNLKLRTSKGSNKKRLSSSDWQTISDNIGITTIMDLLYRKRIKSNYLDTDIFTFDKLKGTEILENLCHIVNRLNLINETYIAKAIKEKEYTAIKQRFSRLVASPFLEKRFKTVIALINS